MRGPVMPAAFALTPSIIRRAFTQRCLYADCGFEATCLQPKASANEVMRHIWDEHLAGEQQEPVVRGMRDT